MPYLHTHELRKLLKQRYKGNAYAFFSEVADGTGTTQSRWADGIAISLWPSRGLTIEGFELKVSRSDWKKELRSPEKAEAVCKFCDSWWVVISESEIVKDGELPDTWGLMCATEDGTALKVKKQAPRLSPVPLDRHFVAAIARRACEQSAEVEAIEAAREEGKAIGRNERDWELRNAKELKERVEAFTKATGIDLNPESYSSRFCGKKPEEIGQAVMLAMEGQERYEYELQRMRDCARRVLEIVGDIKPEEPKKRRRA